MGSGMRLLRVTVDAADMDRADRRLMDFEVGVEPKHFSEFGRFLKAIPTGPGVNIRVEVVTDAPEVANGRDG